MSSSRMVDTTVESSSDPSCSSCAKLKEALEASKKEHSLTLRMVKEKIISTDELIKKYQQKCHESDKHQQQSTDSALKLEAAQMKIESLQSELDRTLQSSEPLRKNVARLHREKSLADSSISELREKLQNFEKINSELLSTAKIKEEQECAWRLEKQVQAHEMQKQKKSLQKSEATISKLQEEVKKAKEKNKELNKLLGQANRKAAKMEQQLQKSEEEIQSVKLEAEFAKALGEDLTEKTPKKRQRQKARQPPRQPPVDLKQTSPSASHPNQHVAHIIEELAMLSDMEPALSPLPPSPDREGMGDSSSSEEDSDSGSSSEDDGSGNEDEDSDYSLGDLADMLIGDHDDGENVPASPMKTRSSDQDIHEDVENSTRQQTTTKDDADCAKTDNESSVRQSPNEVSATDIEVSENLSLENCDVANPESETSKALSTSGIEAGINENSQLVDSASSDRQKRGKDSAKTKVPSNAEKCTLVMPSPQRKAKRRMGSPKPRVMTRSRAKAMKLGSSSDAESSSERETEMEVNSTQENFSVVSDTGLKRDSNASGSRKSNDGGSGNNEDVSSVALVDNMKEFTENSQANESEERAEGNFSFDTSRFDADDTAHLCEPVFSVASLSDVKDQEPTEDNSNVSLVGVEADISNCQRNNGVLSCPGDLLTDSEELVGNEENSNVLLHVAGMDTDVNVQQRNDDQLGCSGALHTDSEKQEGNEDNSNVSLVGLDTDVIPQHRNDDQLSWSVALLTDSEKQAGHKDNSNVLSVKIDKDAIHYQKNDDQLSCSGTLLTDSEEQVDNEDNSNVLSVGVDTDAIHRHRSDDQLSCSVALHSESEKQVGNEDSSNVFTGGHEADSSRLGHSTALLSEKVVNEHNSDVTSAPVSKAAANVPTELEIAVKQEFSSTSESGSKINGDALLNMTRDEKPEINEITSLELKNGNADSILANEMISEKNTEESQTSPDSKITADANGNTVLSQSENKENAFELRDDNLEENNNNVSEDFEVSPELLEVGSTLVADTDWSNQTQPFVGKTENRSIRTIERKSSDVSAVSTTCDGTKNEYRSREQVHFPSDEETDADSFPCVVPGKGTASTSVETSKDDPADVSSSTVEVDSNLCTLTCEKETMMTTTETIECSSTKSHEVETSEDNKLTLEEDGHSHAFDEAMQSCSTDVHEGNDSKGQDSSIQENIPVVTVEPLRKNSGLVKDESFSCDGEEFWTWNQGRKESDCEKVVPASKTVIKEAREPSTSNQGRKNSDCVKDVPSFKTVIEEVSEPSTSRGRRKESDCVIDVPASKTLIKEPREPLTSNEGRKNSDCVTDVPSFKTVIEEASGPSTSSERRKEADCVIDVPASRTAIKGASEPSTSNEGRKNSDCVTDVPSFKTVIEEDSEPSTPSERRKESDCVIDVPASRIAIKEASEPSTSNEGRKNSDCVKDVPSFKTVIEKASEPSTSNEERKESDFERDVSCKAMTKKSSSPSNDEKKHFDKIDLSSRALINESSSTVNEGRRHSNMGRDVFSTATRKESCLTFNEGKNNSPLGRDVSSRADFRESPLTSIQRKRDSALERNVSSRAMNEECSSSFNEGKHADMGRDVSSTATRKESCLTVGRDVSSGADFLESPSTSITRKRNSALERNMSPRAVGNENSSTFNMGKRNSDLGRDVSCTITSKEGSSSNEKELLSYVDVRVPSTCNKKRKHYVTKRTVSSTTTVAEKAGGRKSPSSQLDAEESKLEGRGAYLELPTSPNDADPPDDSPTVCNLMDDSPPVETLFNNLECLLEEFPALSPLPPSPCSSDDEEWSTSPISSSNLNKETSNRVTDVTSATNTFDAHRKPEVKRDRTVNYTEVASRSVKRMSLVKSATICTSGSNKLDISVTPRNRLTKDKTSKSAALSCSGGSASMKPPLQRSASAPPNEEEIISLKRSYQESVSEPAKKNAVSQKSKQMKTQPKISHRQEPSSFEKRLDMSRVPVEKATFSQTSKKSGVTKGPMLVDSKGPILVRNKEPTQAGSKGPILAGTKVPIVAGKKEPKLAGNKRLILAGSKEPILVGDDGPIVEFNEGPVLEEETKNTNNSAKATGAKHGKYRPLSVRPSYLPEVKYVFKCLSRVHEDNVDRRIVLERLTTKRCISSSTPVASAIIQFLKEREDVLIPQILDQLEHFRTDVNLNNWQPVISSFESRLLEVISLLSNDALFGNLIPRLVSLCSRSLTEARCSSNDEEVTKGDLSLCRVLTALCQLKDNLACIRTVCYDVIRSMYGSQNAALELVITMATVWPEVLKTSSDCLRGKQSPLAHTVKLVLLYWAQESSSADLGNILRVLCCWEDVLVTVDELKRFGLHLIQPLREERVVGNVGLGKDSSVVLDRHSFELVKSLELLSCILGWQWTLNELIVNNVWQILKSWAEKETSDELTTNGTQPQAASSNEENRVSVCRCCDFNISNRVSSVTVLADEGTSDKSGFTTIEEKKEERNRVGGEEEVPEIWSKCGKLTGSRLPESQAVLCIQLLGVLCRIAIDNGQTPVREITDMLCGLMEDSSPTAKNKVTYTIQLASAVSLLDMSPWQPERIAAVLGKWVAALKESGSLQAPAYVTQGLVCLKSFLRINQT